MNTPFSAQRCTHICCTVLLLFAVLHSNAQPRLEFMPASSTVNASAYTQVKSPITDPPCPPIEDLGDNQNSFFTNALTGQIFGGAFSDMKRGLPNCKVFSEGNAFVLIDGNGTDSVKIRWWCHSNAQYDCKDPDCAWMGDDTAALNATVKMLIAGVSGGSPVEVTYYWEHFSSITGKSEAVDEDFSIIENASLDLFGQVGFGTEMNLDGDFRFAQRRTGDTTITYSTVAGDSLELSVSAITRAHIEPPAIEPGNETEDNAFADFYGYVIIVVRTPGGPPVVNLPPACPQGLIVFSVDIGSDREFSDPTPDLNEILDPGDLYRAFDPSPIPFFNDALIFSTDPNPSVGNPALTCQNHPLQPFQAILNFDLDGTDVVDIDLHSIISTYGPGMPSIPAFSSNCIHEPQYLLLSYAETRGIHFSDALNCDVPSMHNPADSNMVRGSVTTHDEILSSTLFSVPNTLTFLGSVYPYVNEANFSPLIAPSPVNRFPPDMNDDVDALDWISDPALCLNIYFSVDHEAHYMLGPDTLRPGVIYQYRPAGTMPVIHPTFHLGLSSEVDINAFEFTWLYDTAQQRKGLALVFSVSVNDPFSAANYSGGLDPGALYASFLNGSSFQILRPPTPGNIDAITFTCGPVNGHGSIYVPPILKGIPDYGWGTLDLNLYPNPTVGGFNVEFFLQRPSNVLARVTDISGRTVWQSIFTDLPAGMQNLPVTLDHAEAGFYLVELQVTSGGSLSMGRGKIAVIR